MVQTLVVLEHDGQAVKQSSLRGISLARELGGDYALMILGVGLTPVIESVRGFGGVAVWAAEDPALAEPLADRYAAVISEAVRRGNVRRLVATSSTFSKDILPRCAAKLDAAMVTDVAAVEQKDGAVRYRRPLSAGSLVATVQLEGDVQVLTASATAYQVPSPVKSESPVERIEVDGASLPDGTSFVSRDCVESTRPDLSEARVVVSGGRPLKDRETFEKLIGGLADALGGAVAATRAAVDTGLAPNDCQVGQTGKIVAPELYIGVGVSGAVQHLAGIKDSRVIVAINRDPEAPIFRIATYGLLGDLYDIVPRLIDAVRS